jgi:hypothetical protein
VRLSRGFFLLLLVAFAPATARAADTAAADRAAIVEGVREIAAPGAPGPLCVFGDAAVPAVCGKSGDTEREPVVAVARWGKGRVVAFGHDGYFDAATLAVADTGRLMTNAVRWAAGGASGAAQAAPKVAVHRAPGLATALREAGFAAESLDGGDWTTRLAGFRVLCLNPVHADSDAARAAVAAYVRGGGGLIAVGLGWGWQQLNPARNLVTDHPGNRLLAPAGIVWADGTLERTAAAGYSAESVPALAQATRALDAALSHAEGRAKLDEASLAQASAALMRAARSLPPDDAILRPRLAQAAATRGAAAVPTADKPLTPFQPLERVLLALAVADAAVLPPEKVRAHPAAKAFPGAVAADAPRITHKVSIDTSVPGWHSTGVYAAPGEVITLTVPEAAAGKGLALRIGTHTDRLWDHKFWRRCPEVVTRVAVKAAETRAASPFGGLVYVDAPAGAGLGTIEATLAGAVAAPLFVAGETDPQAWRTVVRHRPAPWGELASKKIVLTLPAEVLRTVEKPDEVMAFWDAVMDACAHLAAIPTDRERPERLAPDQQISAGYMHSGYPIMVLMDMPAVLVDVDRLKRNDHGGVWGLFHEIGHNHQQRDWTFDGTGEVTVNLFTLYVLETVCGLAPSSGHGAIRPSAREKQMGGYLAAPDFERWKQDPFLALIMYLQIKEAFGWEAYTKTFAAYRALPRGERPRTDQERRDQWLVRLSRTVGRNLGPFFQAWGVPTSEAARASVADLPAWMPEGMAKK